MVITNQWAMRTSIVSVGKMDAITLIQSILDTVKKEFCEFGIIIVQ